MTQQPNHVVPELHAGLRLEVARRHANLTQKALATQIGISARSLQDYEAMVRPAKRATLIAWSMVTGVSLQWLESGASPYGPGPDTPTAPDEDAEGRGLRARRDSNPKPSDLVSALIARAA